MRRFGVSFTDHVAPSEFDPRQDIDKTNTLRRRLAKLANATLTSPEWSNSVVPEKTGLPRRLVLLVPPAPDESFASWLDRIAVEMRLPVGVVVDQLGMDMQGSGAYRAPALFGIALTARSRRGVHAATGVGGEALNRMHLSTYDGTVLDLSGLMGGDRVSVQTLRQREWVLFLSSRAYPECLVGSGGAWQLWWQLGAAAVCTVHRLLLLSTCPGCGMELRQSNRKHRVLLSRGVMPRLRYCNNRINDSAGGRTCGYPLAELPRVPAGEALCATQSVYLDAADGHPHPVAGHRLTAAGWTAAFKAICALARFAGPLLDLPTDIPIPPVAAEAFSADIRRRRRSPTGRASGYRTMPRTAPLAAALLSFASTVLSVRTESELHDAVAPLAAGIADGRRRRGAHDPLGDMPMPVFLRQAVIAACPPGRSWRFVWHAKPYATNPTLFARPNLQFRHIPQLAPEADYQELIAPWLPDSTTVLCGRRFASLAVARVSGASSWRLAGAALEVEESRATSVNARLARHLTDPPGFWQAVAEPASRLERRGPIDYQARRRALSTLYEVDMNVWSPVFHHHGLKMMKSTARDAAAWVWTELTFGELRHAPAVNNPEWAAQAKPKARRRTCRRLAADMPASLRSKLREFGEDLLRARRVR